MSLAAGARLGPYEIVSLIGAGGMGEVYRARDTRLDRDVAIKILPDAFAADPDRLARFRREAKTLASLNHPHIGGIHGLEEAGGVTALVLELVEGPTLAERIAQGPVPLDEALPFAQQIAVALETAHENGIIHRDLKPANIKLRPDGTVKVLDFGLAKAVASDSGAVAATDWAQSPTITTPAATRMGLIMGTAAYMSPEQARGKPLDKRSDIWAFGCVLYEMLTGRRAFAGDDVSDALASVLAREVDFAALPAATPPSIRSLIRRCLHKDRGERLRDVGDARIEIRDALTGLDDRAAVTRAPGAARRSPMVALLTAALAIVSVIAVMAVVKGLRPSASPSETRTEITTPPTTVPASLAISPDGRTLAFVATADRQSRLWVRPLDSTSARALAGTDGATNPFWSPDSRSIAFFAENKLKRIDLDGGSIRVVAKAVYRGSGGTWGRTGRLIFSSPGEAISSVSATGGEPVELSGLVQEGSNFAPRFLPDGEHFLYYLRGSADARGVYVARLDGKAKARRLFDADSGAVYAKSGHLLFVRQRTLYAQPFDAGRLELSGDPLPIATDCACLGLSISDSGSIAYRAATGGTQRGLVWFDRAGREIGAVTDSAGRALSMSSPSLSPDGERVAGYRGNPVDGNVDIWLLDARRGAFTRFTSDAGDDVMPVWSPQGDRIVFSSNRRGSHDLYQKPASAGAREELLFEDAQEKTVADWSRDGRFLLFDSRDVKRRGDVWALPLDGGRAFAVAETDFEEVRGQFAPGGNWIAYQSDESGRHEVYVQAFPGPAQKWPISTGGGTQPRWRRDGKELFYVALDGTLMAVPIGLASTPVAPAVGAPVSLFVPPMDNAVQQGDYRPQYMVSADGQRFLVATVTHGASSPISLIQNWKPRR